MSEIKRQVSALFVAPADQTQKYFTYWNPKTILKIKRSFELSGVTQWRQQHNAVLGQKNSRMQKNISALGVWEANS